MYANRGVAAYGHAHSRRKVGMRTHAPGGGHAGKVRTLAEAGSYSQVSGVVAVRKASRSSRHCAGEFLSGSMPVYSPR